METGISGLLRDFNWALEQRKEQEWRDKLRSCRAECQQKLETTISIIAAALRHYEELVDHDSQAVQTVSDLLTLLEEFDLRIEHELNVVDASMDELKIVAFKQKYQSVIADVLGALAFSSVDTADLATVAGVGKVMQALAAQTATVKTLIS